MVFVPCRGGISHNEAEFSSQEQCAKGAQVLLQAVLDYDRQLAERGGSHTGAGASGPVRLRGCAARRLLPRRLERRHQAHARSARHHHAGRRRRGPRRASLRAVLRLARARVLAVADRLHRHSSVLFCRIDRKLSHRRHGAGLSDRPWRGPADDRDRDHAVRRRAARSLRLGRDCSAGGGRAAAVAARRPRSGEARPAGGRLRAVHRGDDLRLLGGRRHRRAACRAGQGQRLFGAAVHRHRPGGRGLCAGAARTVGVCRDGAALEDRARRRRARGDLLQHRHLGDDARADRHRRGAARNQRAVRRDHRGRDPEGAAADGRAWWRRE